ncbi:hypothetical protein EHQ05_19305 [Leptospira yasudae]|uniref:hypothetical protein n=1 Tax=Leptospira yasudae TaxID=2202201 RepID=UPI00108380CB|nr:hypothetical protein [Leptospira yasudae]TGK23333.1 hypothetical protein EHQ05_19305 [Leptospira yasudae]TGM09810.1 hypothetical protein EHQ86_00125 [Leptospira yasudae]
MSSPKSDIRANLNENIVHAVKIIGKSKDRKKVFEAIYKGSKKTKTVTDLIRITGMTRIRILQEGDKLAGNHIVEKCKIDGEVAYIKDETYTHHKTKILSLIDNPSKVNKIPTKQRPAVTQNVVQIITGKTKPKATHITIDDIDSFSLVKSITTPSINIDLKNIEESKVKQALKSIIGEDEDFKDWGGEKNDLYTTKIFFKKKRIISAFALKGRATQGTLTPKKMGRNGDQIQRLLGTEANIFFVVYHSKIEESIIAQLNAFAIGRSLSGNECYYCVIDGNDLQRLFTAYPDSIKYLN